MHLIRLFFVNSGDTRVVVHEMSTGNGGWWVDGLEGAELAKNLWDAVDPSDRPDLFRSDKEFANGLSALFGPNRSARNDLLSSWLMNNLTSKIGCATINADHEMSSLDGRDFDLFLKNGTIENPLFSGVIREHKVLVRNTP